MFADGAGIVYKAGDMDQEAAKNIIKQAILLERRGKAFYGKLASESQHIVLKDFFDMMANEEDNHIHVLSQQLKSLAADGRFSEGNLSSRQAENVSAAVLTPAIIESLITAEFESAAVSAAMAMEEKAIGLYRQWSTSATDPEEKRLFAWLAQWEGQHLKMLAEMDRQITERIWNDNRFWPY